MPSIKSYGSGPPFLLLGLATGSSGTSTSPSFPRSRPAARFSLDLSPQEWKIGAISGPRKGEPMASPTSSPPSRPPTATRSWTSTPSRSTGRGRPDQEMLHAHERVAVGGREGGDD